MKQVLRVILSILLIAACVFGLYAGVLGAKDALNIQKYKTAEAESGLRQIDEELVPGVEQLTENLAVYLDGVGQVADGKAQLAAGYAEYAAGQAQLAAGAQQLADGEAALAAGKAELAANTDIYNKGKELQGTLNQVNGLMSQWQSAKEAVVNGTETLLNANPFDPLKLGVTTYDAFVNATQQTFLGMVRSLLSTDLITNTLGMSLDIPADAESFPQWFQSFVADTNAQLKMYEDGQAQVAAGEKELAAGYAEYANGQAQLAAGAQQLADGEAQLADGLAQLSVFEQGEITLAVGLTRLLTQPSYENNGVGQVFYDGDMPFGEMANQIFNNLLANIQDPAARDVAAAAMWPGFYGTDDQSLWGFPTREGNGDEICKSVLELVREKIPGFNPVTDLFAKNDDGSIRVENGYPLVNLDVARTIADCGKDYINIDQTNAVTGEVMGKVIGYVLLLLASVIGLIAGLLGLFGKGAFGGFGVVTFLLALASLVFTFIKKGFKGYGFGVAQKLEIDADGFSTAAWPWGHNIRDGASVISGNQVITGDLQLKAIVCLAIVAFLFMIVALIARKAIKAARAKKYAYTPAPAAAAPAAARPVAQPVAQPVYAAPVVEKPVVEKVVVTEPVVEKVVVKTPAEIAAEAAAKAAAAQAAADAAAAEAAAAQAAADAAAAAAVVD